MTPRSFLTFIAEIRGYRGAEIASRVAGSVERAGLESVIDQVIDTLSKGYKRRVGLAQAILHDPPVLIMDEPTDGLDPNQKHHVRQLITDMAADKAIIISTHILEEVEAVCSRAVVINKGVIVADGTADDLMQRMHYHGAVSLKVVADRADAAIRALSSASSVARSKRSANRTDICCFGQFRARRQCPPPKSQRYCARRIFRSMSSTSSAGDWTKCSAKSPCRDDGGHDA